MLKNIVEAALKDAIIKAENDLSSAKKCLEERQYSQCATRLQAVGTRFTEFHYSVFDSAEASKS